MVSGIDLVKAQLRIASGDGVGIQQSDIKLLGHCIECRINAEDPYRDFMPNPGRIEEYMPPGGVGIRMDSHLFPGYVIPPFYDSLLGKVICWGRDRPEAIARTLRALDELVIQGVVTTVDFHKSMLSSDDFKQGKVHTRYVQDVFMDRFAAEREPS